MSAASLRAASIIAAALAVAAVPQGGAVAASSSASSCADADLRIVSSATRERARRALVCLVNRDRAARGRRTLRTSTPLGRAAQGHSTSMVRYKYISHTGRDGSNLRQRVARTGYVRRGQTYNTSETITFKTGDVLTARNMFGQLLLSSQHRERVRRTYFRDVGVGLTIGAPTRTNRPGMTLVVVLGVRS